MTDDLTHESRSTLADKLTRARSRIAELEAQVALGSEAWPAVLRAHRGSVLMDRRYHCVCGWVSEQMDSRTAPVLGQADVRAHLCAALRGAL